eukprot:5402392-Prymnesium_polylepis.3
MRTRGGALTSDRVLGRTAPERGAFCRHSREKSELTEIVIADGEVFVSRYTCRLQLGGDDQMADGRWPMLSPEA